MSFLSRLLKRAGVPEIDLLHHPVIGPFIRPFADGLTRDTIGKAVGSLPDDALTLFYASAGAEIKRRGL